MNIIADDVNLKDTKEFVTNKVFVDDDVFYYVENGFIQHKNHRKSGHSGKNGNEKNLQEIVDELNSLVKSRHHSYNNGECGVVFTHPQTEEKTYYLAYNRKGVLSLQGEVLPEAFDILNLPVYAETLILPKWWGIIYSEIFNEFRVEPHYEETEGFTSTLNNLCYGGGKLKEEDCLMIFSSEEEGKKWIDIINKAFSKGLEEAKRRVLNVL